MTVNKTVERLKADVVVAGGGGAGLVAAVKAAETGAKKVIVLEKAVRTGGNAFLAGGMMAVESPLQKRMGEKTTRDEIYKEAVEISKWAVNPRLVRAYVYRSGEVVGWFESKGLKFELMRMGDRALAHGFSERQSPYKYSRGTAGAGPGFVGSSVNEIMLKDCEKYGIKILTKTRAQKIITGANGAVSGILASGENKDYTIDTRSVIIAAGSFGENKEMMEKYLGIHGDVFYFSMPHMTGDGIAMAEEAGAALDSLFALHCFGPCHRSSAYSLRLIMMRPEMVYLNKNGERFIDESTRGGMEIGVTAINRQPDQICYVLLDSKLKHDIQQQGLGEGAGSEEGIKGLDDDFKKEAEDAKQAKIANNWDEMAEYIGADPAVLKATIERYNSFCDNGYDADLIKDPGFLKPLRTPPYYAILGLRGYSYTCGGIKINERMEVYNREGKIIGGLYAAGLNAGGWMSKEYPNHGGTNLTWAFCSGHIAGENAANYVQGKQT